MSTAAAASGNGSSVPGLVPIDAVARRFGIPASTIRYYEERGLVQPVARRSGRRWYGPDEIRQLAIIRFWQKSGQMSLDEIGEILGGPDASAAWQHIIRERIEAITAQIESMRAARNYLEHVLAHHEDSPPDGCEYFEKLIWTTDISMEAWHENAPVGPPSFAVNRSSSGEPPDDRMRAETARRICGQRA